MNTGPNLSRKQSWGPRAKCNLEVQMIVEVTPYVVPSRVLSEVLALESWHAEPL